MEYYCELVNLLADLCVGDNHLTESDCQELLPLTECLPVIIDEGLFSYKLRAAFLNFVIQVHYSTEQANAEIHLSEDTWTLLSYLKDQLWKGVHNKFEDAELADYIFGAIMPMLKEYFAQDFSNLPKLTK